MKKIFKKNYITFLIIKLELSILCEEYFFFDIINNLFNI